MKLRTVLTIAAVLACLRPAGAVVTNVPLLLPDWQATQTPAQVFVHDTKGGNQPEDGSHAAGLRGVRSEDDPGLPLFDAAGNALDFTLEKWRAANGAIDVAPEGEGDRVSLNLHRLIAFGHYSVFVRTDAGSGGPQFAPLDGSGLTNNFDAHQDGAATVTIDAPQHLASGAWIVTIYHSDAQDHGNSPGDLTRTAHQQLLVKLP